MFEISVIKYSRILGPSLCRMYASVGRPDAGFRRVACICRINKERMFVWDEICIFSFSAVHFFF
jgi:hypothetical protein